MLFRFSFTHLKGGILIYFKRFGASCLMSDCSLGSCCCLDLLQSLLLLVFFCKPLADGFIVTFQNY